MITYKEASQNQIKELCEIRKQQLIDEGIEPSIDIDQDLESFFEDCFQNHNLYEILAHDHDKIIATGAVCFYDYPPTYTNQTGRIAYITNMYTSPHYRKQGIATKILRELEEEAKRRNVKIMRLGASFLYFIIYAHKNL